MSKPTELPNNVLEQAVNLRREGLSYRAIQERLADVGATERWVKRVCKGVDMKENNLIEKAVQEVYNLATRPCGVKPSELNEVYYSVFGTKFDEKAGKYELNMSQKDKQTVKRKATALGKKNKVDVLYVPEWVYRESCSQSKQALFSSAETLHYCLVEIEGIYTEAFPDATAWEVSSFMYEVAACNIPSLSPQGIAVRFDNVVDKLRTVEDNVHQV